MPVQNVLTRDTQRDITALVNGLADEYGVDAVAIVGLMLAESGLRELAQRNGTFPDVSTGLTQVAFAWAALPTLTKGTNGMALDTPSNRQIAQAYFSDADNALRYSVPRFASLYRKANGDALLACCYWNAPNLDWSNPDIQHAANKESYRSALKAAEAYRSGQTPEVQDTDLDALGITDVRGVLPVAPQYGSFGPRPLSTITHIVLHHTAGSSTDTPQSTATYQISWAAAGQTGTGKPFPGLAYGMFVTSDGEAYLCNGLDQRTWHSGGKIGAAGANDVSVGICFASRDNPTALAIDGLARAIVYVERQVGRQLTVIGHGQTMQTECPGSGWPGWKPQLQTLIETWRGGAVPAPDVTNGHDVHPALVEYMEQNPEVGTARFASQEITGGHVVWCTVTPQHPKGVLLVYRAWLNSVRVAVWEN